MSGIDIRLIGITELDTDCIVNAANSGLAMGGGVCGVIFREAGARELQAACDRIGHCPTGGAVITPGFALRAKYIVHAVGPIWRGGDHHEPEDLYSCYREALNRAKENDCHSIGFPLISSGIFGYPKDKAWREALRSCSDWITENSDCEMEIIFAVLDQGILDLGKKEMENLTEKEFLAAYDSSIYPKPSLTADIVIFKTYEAAGPVEVLLIRRKNHPFRGYLAFPGGFAEPGETIETTAARELEEETGVSGLSLKLVGIYSRPGRDPRGWTVSAAYTTAVKDGQIRPVAGDDAKEICWAAVAQQTGKLKVTMDGKDVSEELAFDHFEILTDAFAAMFVTSI